MVGISKIFTRIKTLFYIISTDEITQFFYLHLFFFLKENATKLQNSVLGKKPISLQECFLTHKKTRVRELTE